MTPQFELKNLWLNQQSEVKTTILATKLVSGSGLGFRRNRRRWERGCVEWGWDWWGGESVVLGMCRFGFWGWRWLLPWVFGEWETVGIVCFSGKLRKLEEVFDWGNKNYFIIVNSSFIPMEWECWLNNYLI